MIYIRRVLCYLYDADFPRSLVFTISAQMIESLARALARCEQVSQLMGLESMLI